jgi:tetratricopeptide (TPR) repeat protein
MSLDSANVTMVSASQGIDQISRAAREAAKARDWRTVEQLAKQILKRDPVNAEGLFLSGLVAKAARRPNAAVVLFLHVLRRNPARYDAAVELAAQYAGMLRYGDAFGILEEHVPEIGDSPLYLDLAASVYSQINMWDRAWALIQRADDLQPNIPVIMARKAQCAVSNGEIDSAMAIYKVLLQRHPQHQRNHYQLSRLETAADDQHIQQMLQVLETNGLAPRGNIFLYYALGKEFEDIERWDKAFEYYKLAGDAAAVSANHDVQDELDIIDTIIRVSDKAWLSAPVQSKEIDKSPIFIVGLPRTGTTLVERIVSSHSEVESIGETLAFENILRGNKGRIGEIGVDAIRAATKLNTNTMADDYLNAIGYMLGARPMFIEKYTYNYLYLGFIAKSFPGAQIIHLKRNPMDACFAMYKQPYFSFAFKLDDLAQYYPAYDRLMNHWRTMFGDRLIEVSYEALVQDPEGETRQLISRLGLNFEDACLDFDKNTNPSATASSVQIRNKVHSRSVNRWRRFEKHLIPLRDELRNSGIDV